MERLQLEAAMEDKRQNLLRKELAWFAVERKPVLRNKKHVYKPFEDLKNQEKIPLKKHSISQLLQHV